VDLLAEAVEELPQDQLGAVIDVNEPLGNREPVADQARERGRVRLGVEVPARDLACAATIASSIGGKGFSHRSNLRPSKPAAPFSALDVMGEEAGKRCASVTPCTETGA
jgi:hypothetical protein